jgi:hypothetical protein
MEGALSVILEDEALFSGLPNVKTGNLLVAWGTFHTWTVHAKIVFTQAEIKVVTAFTCLTFSRKKQKKLQS